MQDNHALLGEGSLSLESLDPHLHLAEECLQSESSHV